MLPVNEKSTATSDVILNKALTKPAYHKKKDPWRFRVYSALPWPERDDELTWHNRGIEKYRKDIGKLYNHFSFFIASKVTFCSLS